MFQNVSISQIATYFEHIFSRYYCGFHRGYSPQTCLLAMIKKSKKIVDERGVFGALLTDLPKLFDFIPHDLIITKLQAYSSSKDKFYGVPQGSIVSLLLFNIHLHKLFYFLEDLDIASYADNTALYTVIENKESAISALETSSPLLFRLFNNNFMEANSDKSHLIMSCTEQLQKQSIKN